MSATFRLKGSAFTLSILQLESTSIEEIKKQLREKINLAPQFFRYAPVVIDISKIEDTQSELDFTALRILLNEQNLIPVGVRGAQPELHDTIHRAQFAVMQDTDQMPKRTRAPETENTFLAGKATPITPTPVQTTVDGEPATALLINEPIRSGQQIYAQGGDLIITSTISPGSELLADGNIHVYGTLKGRALAGVNGNREARIFCNRLEAELVSIAGQYKIFEEVYTQNDSRVKQLYLEGDQLIISSLK